MMADYYALRIFFVVIAAASISPAALVALAQTVQAPQDGSDCFSSLFAIAVTELLLLYDSGADLSTERIYQLCEDTTIEVRDLLSDIGQNLDVDTVQYFPLTVFNPHVTVRCGSSGNATRNCFLDGATHMVSNMAGTPMLKELLQYLPLLAPSLTEFPTSLPDNFAPDSSYFRMQGITFTGGENANGDFAPTIMLSGPGQHMEIIDCYFRSRNAAQPVTAAVALLARLDYLAHPQSEGPYSSLNVTDCVFEDSVYGEGAILFEQSRLGSNVSAYDFVPEWHALEVEVRRNLFRNLVVFGGTFSRAVIKADGIVNGSIADNCFLSIDMDQMLGGSYNETALIQTEGNDAPSVNITSNYGEGNTVSAGTHPCNGVGLYGPLPSNATNVTATETNLTDCIQLHADTCAIPIPPPPTPSPATSPTQASAPGAASAGATSSTTFAEFLVALAGLSLVVM